MKSLIILKGLDPEAKKDWIKNENLDNYFLDINVLRQLYSTPDLQYPGKEILEKSYIEVARKTYLEILITRLSKGCLVVVDTDNIVSDSTLETLALIFGYTVFYTVWDIPQDYLSKPKKYIPTCYIPPKRNELEKNVNGFLKLQLDDKNLITSFSDVLDYWKKNEPRYKIKSTDTILHISDIHSNWTLYKNAVPKFKKFKYVIFHGDYIDGPEFGGSRKMMDLAKKGIGKNTIWLEGNHELRLRKYLGTLIVKQGIKEILEKTIPADFINTTQQEFLDLNIDTARNYLQAMNKNLKMYAILEEPDCTYVCTHSGLTYYSQLDPRFIGNVIYGSKDIQRVDKLFCEYTKNYKPEIISVHAHCKYNNWNPHLYERVINIDPRDENSMVLAVKNNKEWDIWEIKEDSK